jgi:hypothetical protein
MDEALGRQRLEGGAIKLCEELGARASAVALQRIARIKAVVARARLRKIPYRTALALSDSAD